MANTRNTDWKETLKQTNEKLAGKAQIIVTEEDGQYQVDIKSDKTVETYAQGCYENEVSDCIIEAQHKAELSKVEHLAEEYLLLTDSEKDEFLRVIEG